MFLIDPELWSRTRAGSRAGRGFRYQDAIAAWLVLEGWSTAAPWQAVIPEGLDDLSLHGESLEIRAQLKSRHDPQSSFAVAELAQYISKAARDLPPLTELHRTELAMILERPVAGLNPTGWDRTLAGVGPGIEALKAELQKAMNTSPEIVRDILARTHLLVEANPIERALPYLEGSGLAPAFARLAFQLLRQAAGAAADENFRAPVSRANALGATLVQQQIDAIRQLADPAAFLSLTQGLCEVANFDVPLNPADFYQGINVAPGHVGAGLVFERPELTTEILEALEAKHAVLVAGPSGAGKSALSWLAAFHSRHVVRWYRLRQIGREDVGKIVALARLLDARAERPVGFVVDDVGQEATAGWDRLALECEAVPGILAIATVRQEDLFRLETASRLPIVRPQLDEHLAERLWRELTRSGASNFRFWREPFEMSRGLLLEYTHLLTEGRRLQETLDEQVRRRLIEQRDDELTVLRTVVFAAAHGGAVDQQRLLGVLGWEHPRLARALSRLVDEHAIRIRDGALLGLHDIRSTYLDNRLREVLAVPVEEQLADAVRVLVPAQFALFIVQVLRRWPTAANSMQTALAVRIGAGDVNCWAPIFHGLGLATADLIAIRWLEISRECGVEDRFSSLAMTLAFAGSALDGIPAFASITAACEKFRTIDVADLRWAVLKQLQSSESLPSFSLDAYHQFVAALLPLHGATPLPAFSISIDNDLLEIPLIPFLDVARTVRELGLKISMDFVEKGGGSAALLDRLYHQQPWVTPPILDQVGDIPIVEGHVRCIPEAQPDMHGAVIRYCELMMAAAPEAERVICNAIGPDGKPAGFGDFKIATKNMPRGALTVPARVAWNRAQLRAVQRVIGAPQITARISNLAGLIEDSAVRLTQAAELYCRMEKPGPKWALLTKARGWLNNHIEPPRVDEAVATPLSEGTYSIDDDIARFATGVHDLTEQLCADKLEKPSLVALRACELARDSEKLLDADLWRFAAVPPLDAIRSLRTTLVDIRAILGDYADKPTRRAATALRLARSSRSRPALVRAASDARARADRTIAEYIERVKAAFKAFGLEVKIYARPPSKDSGYRWPDFELAGLLAVDSPVDWLKSLEHLPVALADFDNHPTFFYAPLVNGFVAPMAVQKIQSVFPCQDFALHWAEHVPYPMLEDDAFRTFALALDAVMILSSIFRNQKRQLNDVEDQYALTQIQVIRSAVNQLIELRRDQSDEVLEQATNFLIQTVDQVSHEEESGPSVAEESLAALDGRLTDFVAQALYHRIALIDRAVRWGTAA